MTEDNDMTHNDPGNPRPGTRTTDGTTRPVDTTTATGPTTRRAEERSSFTMLLGILLAALIIVPLLVWWLWDDEAPDATLPPAAQIEVAPETDAAVSPAVEDAAPEGGTITPGTDGDTDATLPPPETDVAPADDAVLPEPDTTP